MFKGAAARSNKVELQKTSVHRSRTKFPWLAKLVDESIWFTQGAGGADTMVCIYYAKRLYIDQDRLHSLLRNADLPFVGEDNHIKGLMAFLPANFQRE